MHSCAGNDMPHSTARKSDFQVIPYSELSLHVCTVGTYFLSVLGGLCAFSQFYNLNKPGAASKPQPVGPLTVHQAM